MSTNGPNYDNSFKIGAGGGTKDTTGMSDAKRQETDRAVADGQKSTGRR